MPMDTLALIASAVALIFSITALISQRRFQARYDEQPRTIMSDTDEMLHAAWLEELEARGEALLRRIGEAEARSGAAPLSETPILDPEVQQTEPSDGALSPKHRAEHPGPSVPIQTVGTPEETSSAAVRRLAAQGHGPGEIARRLHMGRGEVELILGLSGE